MAKVIMVMLAAVLLVLSAACGGGEGVSTEDVLYPATVTAVPAATPVPLVITRPMTVELAERAWACFQSSGDYREWLEGMFRANFDRAGYSEGEADYAWDGVTANEVAWTDASVEGWQGFDAERQRMVYSAEWEALRKYGCE